MNGTACRAGWAAENEWGGEGHVGCGDAVAAGNHALTAVPSVAAGLWAQPQQQQVSMQRAGGVHQACVEGAGAVVL
jgi:hypothetical protein